MFDSLKLIMRACGESTLLILISTLYCCLRGACETQLSPPKPLPAARLRALAKQISDDKIMDTVDKIAIVRTPESEGIKTVREYISSTLESLGWTVEVDWSNQETPLGKKNFANVIATLDNSASKTLVLACHYDSKIEPTGFLGAIDSAVPCAQLLHIASKLKSELAESAKNHSKTTLQLIFFDGEEAIVSWTGNDHTYGSRHLAEKWENQTFGNGSMIDRIEVFVLLDLIGNSATRFIALYEKTVKLFDRMDQIQYLLWSSDLMQKKAKSPSLYFQPSATTGNYWRGIEDDHDPFLDRGVPILHLICDPFPSEVWHFLNDTPANLDKKVVVDVAVIVGCFVAEYLGLQGGKGGGIGKIGRQNNRACTRRTFLHHASIYFLLMQ